MRATTRALVAALVAGGVLLAGCSSASSPVASSPGASPAPSASGAVVPIDWTGASVPKVSGSYGDKPTITFSSAPAPTQLARTVLQEGTGPVIQKGNMVAVDYLGQVYTGKVFDNSYDRGQPAGFGIGTGQVIPGWDDTLIGMKVGSRVLISIPPAEGYGAAGQPQAGIKGTDTLVFVVDVITVYGADAAGDPKATVVGRPPAGITVGGELGKVPTVAVAASATKPTKAVTTLLARGTGAALPDGLGVFQFVAVDWTGKPVQSTWADGTPAGAPVAKGKDQGIFDSLGGMPIGSRVLLELPAGSSGGPYAVVVDIVAHVPTAKQSLSQ